LLGDFCVNFQYETSLDDYPDTDKWTELIENDDDEGIEKGEWQNEKEMKDLMMSAKEDVLYEASVSE
jgi:hypothetical protein